MAELAKQNAVATANLQKIGISIMGAKQILSAQMVTSQKDRDLLAKIIQTDHSAADAPVKRYYFETAWPTK